MTDMPWWGLLLAMAVPAIGLMALDEFFDRRRRRRFEQRGADQWREWEARIKENPRTPPPDEFGVDLK